MAETLTPGVEKKWDGKLYNWSLWYIGGRDTFAATAAYDRLEQQDPRGPGPGGGETWEYGSRDPPALIGEALDTHELVSQLDPKPLEAIKAWYCWTGTLEARAEDAGCHVNTLRNRRDAAILDLERLQGGKREPVKAVKPLVVRRSQYVPDDVVD